MSRFAPRVHRPGPGKPIQRAITVEGKATSVPEVVDMLHADHAFGAASLGELERVARDLDGRDYRGTRGQLFGAARNLLGQLSRYSPETARNGQWAVLHRLRGGAEKKGYADFVAASGKKDAEEAQRQDEQAKTKYSPPQYGGRHTWDANARWIRDVAKRRVLLTDLPLRRENLMRKIGADGKPTADYDEREHGGRVSAYGREIAWFLSQGHASAGSEDLGGMQTHVLAPSGTDGHAERVSKPEHVDHEALERIAESGRTDADASKLLAMFGSAGLPTTATRRQVDEYRSSLAERREARARGAEAERVRAAHAEAVRARMAEEAAASSDVKDRGGLRDYLVRELTRLGCTKKRYNPKGAEVGGLVSGAIAAGHVGEEFSKGSLKDFVKEHVRGLLPD